MTFDGYRAVRNTVDIVVLATVDRPTDNKRTVPQKGIQVLLVKRDREPFKDTWTIPGGFVDYDEPLHETVHRKLKQKTGIDDMYTEQLYTYGDDIKRDPRDRVISIGYIALTTKDRVNIRDNPGDNETAWFWVNTVRDNGVITDIYLHKSETEHTENLDIVTELGFDHKKILIDALNRMANKIMYTDIGFNLVGKTFTIKELQRAYEAIIGKEISGFRRLILDKIEPTGTTTTFVNAEPNCFRPAQLYTKKLGGK